MLYGIPMKYEGVCDAEFNFRTYFKLLTNKCMSLFKWEGLPETIDERFLMEQLILRGKVCFTEINGKLYALNGNVGGEPDCYYQPTQFIIANPILGSKTVKIRQEDGSKSLEGLTGILVALTDIDQLIQPQFNGGLYNLIYQTAGLLADNTSSINCAQINGRATVGYVADSEALANSAEEVLLDVYSGKPYRVMSQDIMDKIQAMPLATSGINSTLMTLIEAHQYILAQFYNEIGIGGNWNMKRERINTAETELMKGSLDLSIWQMEKSLKEGIELVNQLFGTSITVDINEDVIKEEPEDVIEDTPAAEDENVPVVTEDEDKTETSVEEEEKKSQEEVETKTEEKEEKKEEED